ncbi:hypothetical protein TWF694_009255 [Orbilia ellipsospora]|uniref:Ankyrin n=1 Tax=Orbilia ellipsospora TaxID=2528407 RepID=A0AAV9XFL4_9PEZI
MEGPSGITTVFSPLESLPNELLDSILDFIVNHDHSVNAISCVNRFDYTPLSRLSQCSRCLYRRIGPVLYGTQDARNIALRYGCKKGNLKTIRKTVSQGARAGTVLMRVPQNTYAINRGYSVEFREILSLHFTLKARKLDAFKLLLELGAGVGPHDCTNKELRESQLKVFGQKLSHPRNVKFLEAIIEASKPTPDFSDSIDSPPQSYVIARALLFPDIVGWGSPQLLKKLLDNGAEINHAVLCKTNLGKELLPPLSAAALRGDSQIFHLLVARGAKVTVDSSEIKPHAKYVQMPSIMAARFMAKHHDTSTLQACVDAGVDINRPCHVDPDPGHPEAKHVCTTPLLTYLDSIESWDIPATARASTGLRPIDGVNYLIYTLGAKVQSPVMRLFKQRYSNRDQELHDRTFAGVPSPVELLLVKWGIESLEKPEFFSLIEFLIKHGGVGSDPARVLVRFEGQNKPSSGVDVEGLWQRFLTLLEPQLLELSQASKNALLRRVIVDKVGMRRRVAHPSNWVKVCAIGRASIDAIIRAGADINDISPPDMRTPLHEAVSWFIHTDCLTEESMHDHEATYSCPHTEEMAKTFGNFLSFLVSCGADPLKEDTNQYREEKTVFDTLLSPMKAGRIKFVGGTTERGLMHLVAKIRGTTEVTEYTGERKPYNTRFWLGGFRSRNWWPRDECSVVTEADT